MLRVSVVVFVMLFVTLVMFATFVKFVYRAFFLCLLLLLSGSLQSSRVVEAVEVPPCRLSSSSRRLLGTCIGGVFVAASDALVFVVVILRTFDVPQEEWSRVHAGASAIGGAPPATNL